MNPPRNDADDQSLEESDPDPSDFEYDCTVNDEDGEYNYMPRWQFTEAIVNSGPDLTLYMSLIGPLDDYSPNKVANTIRNIKKASAEKFGDSWRGRLKEITVILRYDRHTMAVARRATRIFDAAGVEALESFTLECEGEDGEVDLDPQTFVLTDYYLSWLANPRTIAADVVNRPMKVHLGCLGEDPRVWSRFVNRFPAMESLRLGGSLYLHNANQRSVAALCSSFRGLSNLRSVSLSLNVRGSTTVSRLLSGLSSVPKLETLRVKLEDCDEENTNYDPNDDREERNPTELVHAVNHTANVLESLNALKDFTFEMGHYAAQSGVDSIVLLEKVLLSSTLERIKLEHAHLSRSDLLSRNTALGTNRSLKDCKIEDCFLMPDFWRLLPRFSVLYTWRIHGRVNIVLRGLR
jgi:hypothetical protein